VSGVSERESRVQCTTASQGAGPRGQFLAVHRSRKRIAPFRLHMPSTSAEAVVLLRQSSHVCVLAGGIDVINRMKCGDTPEDVVYVGRLPSLRQIELLQGHLEIGATSTHHEIATSPATARAVPALAATWAKIANPRVRFKGTVGGNLMAKNRDYEAASILAAADAKLCFLTPEGSRTIACRDYFRTRQQEPAWLLETIRIPSAYNLHLDYDRSLKGIAGIVVAFAIEDDTVVRAHASVTWAFEELRSTDLPFAMPCPLPSLVREAARIAGEWVSDLPDPIGDHLASSAYRRRIIEVHLRRALERAGQGRVT
jgi:aerobic carbon-monoxide dehydrogenase medium subunit